MLSASKCRRSSLARRLKIETQFTQQSGKGNPRITLDRHLRPCVRLVEAVLERQAVLGYRLPSLNSAVPGLGRQRQQPDVVRL
jgi:hypothetical protein